MAIRYTTKVFNLLTNVKNIVDRSDMNEADKEDVFALLNAAEQLTQAGHLLACGRTISALETQTGMSEQQMRETQQFMQLSTLEAGETISVRCPREWFNFCRALLKLHNPSMRLRSKPSDDGVLIVTRIQ